MILALEGPDRCGKSTAFAGLYRYRPELGRYVPALPLHPSLMPHMEYVEERQAHVWDALYDESTLYVCDRHFSVSGQVYARMYGRSLRFDPARWAPHVHVAYFYVPVDELRRRYEADKDALFDSTRYEECQELYKSVLEQFKCTVVHADVPLEDVVWQLRQLARRLRP